MVINEGIEDAINLLKNRLNVSDGSLDDDYGQDEFFYQPGTRLSVNETKDLIKLLENQMNYGNNTGSN